MGRADWEPQFTEHVTARVQPLRRLAYGLCGDWHAAEEMAHLTFVRLYRAWPRVRAGSVDHYTRRVLVSAFLSHRHSRRWVVLTAPPSDPAATGDPQVADRFALQAALADLAPRQRAAVVLRHLEDLPVAEVATLLRVSEDTVKNQNARGVETLRRAIPDRTEDMLDIGAALRDYVTADEPPTGLSGLTGPIGPVVAAAGRRSRRNRRLSVIGALLSLLVVVGGLSIVRPWTPDRTVVRLDGFVALSPCPARPGARPATPVIPEWPMPDDVRFWALKVVTCYLADRVPAMLPAARFASVPGWRFDESVGPLQAAAKPDGNRVDATVLIRDGAGTGDLSVFVGLASEVNPTARRDECSASAACRWTGTDAAYVLTWSIARADNGYAQNIVQVVRGQTWIDVIATDSAETLLSPTPARTRPSPVLTIDQLTELALGTELMIFP